VIHVYDGTKKVDQAMSLDTAEIERMVCTNLVTVKHLAVDPVQ
jgi:hypothetical protein